MKLGDPVILPQIYLAVEAYEGGAGSRNSPILLPLVGSAGCTLLTQPGFPTALGKGFELRSALARRCLRWWRLSEDAVLRYTGLRKFSYASECDWSL